MDKLLEAITQLSVEDKKAIVEWLCEEEDDFI